MFNLKNLMNMTKNDVDPSDVKKAFWKIVVYIVSVLAALYGGNAAAQNGTKFWPLQNGERIENVR